jgi:hypothetical protein
MKTIRNWTATIALTIALIIPYGNVAVAEPVAGDPWIIGNFCVGVDLNFMREFTNRIVRGGVPAYRAIVTTKGSPCFDLRHNLTDTVNVILRERLWRFTLPEGEKLVMWRVEDAKGAQGYTWLSPDQGQDPGI